MDDMQDSHSASPAAMSAAAAAQASHFMVQNLSSIDTISRSTSPGVPVMTPDEDDKKRYRPRTFAYFSQLPFAVEEDHERDVALDGILKNLYIAIKAEDFAPGALHWTRELQGWLNLKFEMVRELRATLAQLYYHLALAPGLDHVTADRFTRMVLTLTKKKTYLKPGDDLYLDWRPLWKEIKGLILPSEVPAHQASRRKGGRHLLKLAMHAQTYFDPSDRKEMLEEFLPFFSTSDLSCAYTVVAAINVMVPTAPSLPSEPLSQPAEYLPTYFHLWSLMTRSKSFDIFFLDIFSRLSRDYLSCTHVPFSEHGIFTREQSDHIFTAILRLTEIPVGQANSPYASLDYSMGAAVYLERDKKKHPTPHVIARWVVHSLSPMGLKGKGENSVMSNLEGLIESIDTFFHPSNQGSWTNFLAQFVFFLTHGFVSRWNREQKGELDTPADRRINNELKKRFVLALKEVTFMGLFAKSMKVVSYYTSTLQWLAYLEPNIILPGALQRFYPSLQGLVEVHRTTSSLHGLMMISNILSKHKGYRCHLTALLALALPGIDANDLGKTQYTLSFIQSVAYSIPFVPLKRKGSEVHDTSLAVEWVQGQMERMELEGQDVQINYEEELSDEDEANIVRSSTAGFGEFVVTLLGKVFTLLENLPDASQVRANSPEDNVINTLPAALTPLFASLSPELFDLALDKVATFVNSHVVHQARDAMAWICNALCKVHAEKTLKTFIPMLIVNIRNEIDYNGAASDRSSGSDVMPRDRALVWHVSMLSMTVVNVGAEVLKYKKELYDIAQYMQEKCRGIPTIHISNYIHHLLLNLTHTYSVDTNLYEPEVIERGLDVDDWGKTTPPAELSVRWHRPSTEEIQFAVELFESQARGASKRLESLMSEDTPISRKGKNKEWGDEVSRQLSQLRLVISGASALFDPKKAAGEVNGSTKEDGRIEADGDTIMEDDDPLAEVADDEELKRQYRYPSGYILDSKSQIYSRIHELREDIGWLLTKTHNFLKNNHQDDVTCFTALYGMYRTWITDVGNERSAHPLERLVRLYKADINPFKVPGLRKVYPRPLLVKRADAYQLQRVKYNSSYRQKSELDKRLLLDLAESCVSSYADVRRVAQGAQDSSLKVLIGGRPHVIPVILEQYRIALEENDHDRIKGAMYTLLYTTLTKTLLKDWRFAPDLMRLYIKTARVDKASIQQLLTTSLYPLLEFGKPFERMVIVDEKVVDTIKPSEDCSDVIKTRNGFILERRTKVEAKKHSLGLELIDTAKTAHWKVALKCTIFATNMCLRFDTLVPPSFIDLVAQGTNDEHPGLRSNYQLAFKSIFAGIDVRAMYAHEYRNYLLEKAIDNVNIQIEVPSDNPQWTDDFLDSFSSADEPKYFVDADHPGWLVWGKKFNASKSNPARFEAYDETENRARKQIGQLLTKDWFKKCFDFLKQEPRDSNHDKFRMVNVMLLMHVFDMVIYGAAAATFDDIKELVKDVYGDGSDKHQHRATAEILGAMLSGGNDEPKEHREKIWDFAGPKMLDIFADTLTPDNVQYWIPCLHLVIDSKDPRRCAQIVDKLSSFRLDMSSNAAFKESSKVQLMELIINDGGWHFRKEKPILEDFLAHIDHPYKSVREAIGRVIATIYRTRYHESYPNVTALLNGNKAESSLGIRPYQSSEEFTATMTEIFSRLEKWRHERTPGQQEPSSYTNGSKTVLTWLDSMLSSQECTQLVPFFPEPFMDQLLHMMDVKEDPELMRLAYHVYRHLANIPFRDGEDEAFIKALIRIGRSATSWHQRLRALVNMQVIYFRRLFLTAPAHREMLFEAVGDMLADAQLEVRDCASATLAGMIRCSPASIRNPIINALIERFKQQLASNPMPKRQRSTGVDTPVDTQKQIVRRHAAVLGLGALIEAFPYATPPPAWMPDVLAHLARRPATDPGVVGKAAKSVLAEFKKTRQDSWMVDQKYFTSDQLEDLEGVLWKSYFA